MWSDEISNKCTPLWREAHLEVKMYKAPQVRALLEVEMSKKCTPLWREAHLEVKMYKAPQVRALLEVEMSKKCTPLWREAHLRHLSVGPLLEVALPKKCTPLWREAGFQVKMYKTPQLRSTFRSCDVEKVHAVVVRSTFPSQNVKNITWSDHF